MLRMWLAKYKWAICIGLLVLYTGLIWHVSGGYHETEFQKERVQALEEKSRIEAENRTLSADLAQSLLREQAAAKKKNTTVNKGITDAAKSTGFTCPLPDSVRDSIANKLKTR